MKNYYIKRKKVYVSFNDEEIVLFREKWYDEYIGHLYFNENHIRYGETLLYLNDIDYINISMCSYLRSISFTTSSVPYEFHLDVDIHIKDDIYLFEVFNYKMNPEVFKYFDKCNIKIVDNLNLKELYMEKNNIEVTRYLHYNFKKYAKKYNLDNPRGDFFKEHYYVTKDDSLKMISLSKNIFYSLFKKNGAVTRNKI